MRRGENAVKTIFATLAISLALAGSAGAQMKLEIGCTATSDCASAMLAVDEGIFKKYGPEFTKQPLKLVKATPPNPSEPVLKPEQLAWWIQVMSSQEMLQSKLDTTKLVPN
jgi:ABC-type nitrate/sulfonate/bicarbonate transport system substrate-binding protein